MMCVVVDVVFARDAIAFLDLELVRGQEIDREFLISWGSLVRRSTCHTNWSIERLRVSCFFGLYHIHFLTTI